MIRGDLLNFTRFPSVEEIQGLIRGDCLKSNFNDLRRRKLFCKFVNTPPKSFPDSFKILLFNRYCQFKLVGFLTQEYYF